MSSSLPSRERGLKYREKAARPERAVSLPSRERGLKCIVIAGLIPRDGVAPFTGAWIEIATPYS